MLIGDGSNSQVAGAEVGEVRIDLVNMLLEKISHLFMEYDPTLPEVAILGVGTLRAMVVQAHNTRQQYPSSITMTTPEGYEISYTIKATQRH